MNFKDITHRLNKFSKKHDLFNEAMVSCLIAIKNARNENPHEGYPLREIEFQFEKQTFAFHRDFGETPILEAWINLYHVDEEDIRIGYYTFKTDATEEKVDDWLVFEKRI